jgi:uncharacterized protein
LAKNITINGKTVEPGERRYIDLRIARLPTHTVIDLPIYVSRAIEDGPTLLLTAGLHGDEINGVEIIRRLIADRSLKPARGTVIAIPVVNIYGFLQQARYLPDGKDLNRSFPGSKNGSLAARVAHAIVDEILPVIDFGVDFHTGGSSKDNFPQIRCVVGQPQNMALANAFAPPFILNSKLIDRSFRKAAQRRGKSIIVYEAGESLRFDEHAIQEGIAGTLRLMKHFGMLEQAPIPNQTVVFEKSTWIRARVSGLFRTDAQTGARVTRGQLIGTITDPFGESQIEIHSRQNGYIVGINHMPVVNAGDALIHLGH